MGADPLRSAIPTTPPTAWTRQEEGAIGANEDKKEREKMKAAELRAQGVQKPAGAQAEPALSAQEIPPVAGDQEVPAVSGQETPTAGGQEAPAVNDQEVQAFVGQPEMPAAQQEPPAAAHETTNAEGSAGGAALVEKRSRSRRKRTNEEELEQTQKVGVPTKGLSRPQEEGEAMEEREGTSTCRKEGSRGDHRLIGRRALCREGSCQGGEFLRLDPH